MSSKSTKKKDKDPKDDKKAAKAVKEKEVKAKKVKDSKKSDKKSTIKKAKKEEKVTKAKSDSKAKKKSKESDKEKFEIENNEPIVEKPKSRKGRKPKKQIEEKPLTGGIVVKKTRAIAVLDTDPKKVKQDKDKVKEAVKKATEINPTMRMCYRCSLPFEPAKDENICQSCDNYSSTRFDQLFGDEDPYSPQITIRTNKIARIIPRKRVVEVEDEEEDY